jgi:hypothetical protein
MRYDGSITIKTQLDNSQFEKEIEYVESQMRDIEKKISQADMGFDVGDTQKLEMQYEKLSKKLGTLITKQKELDRTELTNVENSIKKVGSATSNVISKIGKWALAIFSVRTAYGAVSSAMSTLSQYDAQLKTDLEYIRFSVAMALKPVIEFIVNLAYKLLGVVRAIGLTLFNFDIFSEATAENFKKMTGNATKLKKTLAGFDEMNVLNSASTGGGGGIGGDIDVSFGNIEEETEKAITSFQKIKNNYESMQKTINDSDAFNRAYGIWGTFIQGISRISLGITEIVVGAGKIIKGIVTGDGQEILDGIELIGKGIWNFVLGIVETIIGLVMGLIYEIVSGIVGLGKLIIEILVGLVTGIYKYVIKPIWDFFAWLGTQIKVLITTAITGLVQTLSGIGKTVKKYVIDPIVTHFENMWNSLKKGGIKGLVNYIIECWEKGINWIGKNFTKMLNKLSFKNPITGEKIGVDIKYNPVNLPRLAKGTILNNPGQGVLVGGRAIAAEAGREAFLPLSDTQLLEELGSTIGKYITINANITNSMNGRVISRELKRINANDNFAMNK